MRIRENDRFRSRAGERSHAISADDFTEYVWFFHRSRSARLYGQFAWWQLKKLAWLIAALAIPWLISLLSFQVANSICILFVFVIWPVLLIMLGIARYSTVLPQMLRRGFESMTTATDIANVLTAYFFLIAHPQGLWNDLFTIPPDAVLWQEWPLFLLDKLVSAATLGASGDMDLVWSGIKPTDWRGGLAVFGLNLLIGWTVVETVLRAVRWYRGKEFLTGSLVDMAIECRARAEVPGGYVSRVGRVTEVMPEALEMASIAESYPKLAAIEAKALGDAVILPKLGDEKLYGKQAHRALRVTHVEVGEVRFGAEPDEIRAIKIFHTKFIPTDDVRATLDLAEARLTLIFNGDQKVEFNTLHVLRPVAGQDHIDAVVLFELSENQVVGIRRGPIVVT